MKELASILVVGSATLAVLQWWQIAYRLRLFFVDYEGKPYVNHIGDRDFSLIYIINALLLFAAVVAVRLFRQNRRWRMAAAVIGVINLVGWATLFAMHRTGALVEYSEFIRHMKGGI